MDSSCESSQDDVDLEKYRKEYESYEHWELRKAFMQKYWEQYAEDVILCLAQVFVNMEFLGCKYPQETMNQVAQMAKNVPEIQKHRGSRRNRLKRTFVGAQNAVQAKLQRSNAPRKLGLEDWSKEEVEQIERIEGSCKPTGSIVKLNQIQRTANFRGLLRDVIFFEMAENDANGSLNKTISYMQKIGKLEMKFDAEQKKFFYVFDGQIIAEGAGDSKKIAKKLADDELITTLKRNCFTIKSKMQFFSPESIITPRDQNESNSSNHANNKLQENNLGFKMLKMLGWKGGSLGATGNDGIIDPVNLEIKIGRKGLGADSDGQFDHKWIRDLIRNFKNNQVEYDLVFNSEFTKEERAQIHQIAQQLDLRTKSYGKNNSRHIVISSKLSPLVLRQKLLEGDPHLLEKYDILPPLKKS